MTNDNNGNIRLAIILLGLAVLVCLVGGIFLVNNDKSLPDALIAIGSSSATAITLVISRPVGGTQDVREMDEPIQVEGPVQKAPAKRARGEKGALTVVDCIVIAAVAVLVYVLLAFVIFDDEAAGAVLGLVT